VTQIKTLFFIPILCAFLNTFGQPDYSSMDIKKPAKYENSKLGAEKTDETKFKTLRHFIQNTVSHFNYYYNANLKLNEIVARARAQNKDDYTKLLSFYDYSLEVTSKDKKNLDSIIMKVTGGILNHDLRNDWVDNLYMLMGKAYYYRKQLDSAYITFQFVNYAFSPKEEGGYDIPIGSNVSSEKTGNSLIVATKEKSNIVKKTFSLPPSRNESFIWQIKTYIARGLYAEASGLMELMKQDPQFPKRLYPDLEEVEALSFYSQHIYDSTARHLINMLPYETDLTEKYRWEYLVAQLYEETKNREKAQEYYKKTYEHTFDPVMEVYARLYYIRQNKVVDDKMIQQNIDALMSMVKKARFENYRDIIYYAAAQIELERKNKTGAIAMLLKCVKYAIPENQQRSKAFLQLGNLYYSDKIFRKARNYYDSVDASDHSAVEDPLTFVEKRKTLDHIILEMDIIDRQDSLQRLAAMPKAERDAYLMKILKQMRRQQGLSEEENYSGGVSFNNNNAPADIFGSSGGNTDWYFYNSALKSRGYTDFRSRWGNRQNSDFWQVSSKAGIFGSNANNKSADSAAEQQAAASAKSMTLDALLKGLPLTAEKLKKSNDSVEHAQFEIGSSFQDGLSEYLTAIGFYDSLLKRFPQTRLQEQTLFNMFYCYKKLGDEQNAQRILKLMEQLYPNGKLTNKAAYPDAYKKAEEAPRVEATRRYENIYNAFIEGRFEEAMANKKQADSAYGEKFWTPQLLFIEGVYFVRAQADSLAKVEFSNLIRKYPKTPMAAKAQTFLDVLSRRRQIEDYLTKLQVERAKDDSIVYTEDKPATTRPTITYVPLPDSLRNKRLVKTDTSHVAIANQQKIDSARLISQQLANLKSPFAYAPAKGQTVSLLLNKVDPVYVNEAKNAFNRYNQENYYNLTLDIQIISLNDTMKIVAISGFGNSDTAMSYIEKARKMAPMDIIPWLPQGKYSILIISYDNMELLKANKDIMGYKKFLNASYPGKFQ
jgi:outer membrane protein assembly factor BamD (BamD/ComL family)